MQFPTTPLFKLKSGSPVTLLEDTQDREALPSSEIPSN